MNKLLPPIVTFKKTGSRIIIKFPLGVASAFN